MGTSFSLTRKEVRDYDAQAIVAGIPGIVLMENAGRGATELLMSLGVSGAVAIVCGKGNNGGDGFVMARHLACAGKSASVELVADPDELRGDARIAFQPLRALGIPVLRVDSGSIDAFARRLAGADWIVDALLGTGTAGDIRPPFDQVIEAMNAAGRKILAVDLPSGLDTDTGEPLGAAIRAHCTATFVARKRGFDNPASEAYTGPVHVLGIGAGPIIFPNPGA